MRASSTFLSFSVIACTAAAFAACSSSPANTPATPDAAVPDDSGGGGDTGTDGGGTGPDGGTSSDGGDGAAPSSARLVYSGANGSSQDPDYQLFIVTMSDTTKETALTTKTGVEDYATDVAADGKTILFTRKNRASGSVVLMTVGVDGTGEKQIYSCAALCSDASFGADGKVLFVERQALASTGKVRSLDAAAGTATDVGTPSAACTIDGFALSRDRTQMLVTVNDAQGTGGCAPEAQGIYRAPISGTAFGAPFAVPGFAKTNRPWVNAKAGDGDVIYFYSPAFPVDGGTEQRIFSVTFNGTDVKTVVQTNGAEAYAVLPTSAPTGAGVLVPVVSALSVANPSLEFFPAAGGSSKEVVGSRFGLSTPLYIP